MKPVFSDICRIAVCTLVIAGMLAGSAHAALLVYEPFSGYSTGAISGQAATGLGLTGNYSATLTSAFNYTATGLSFNSSVPASGGALSINSNTGANLGVLVDLGAASPINGTLYTRYVFKKINSFSTDAGSLVEMRINNGINDTTASSRFRAQANTDVNGTNAVGAGYDNTATAASSAITDNANPFIIIGKFTNVGVANSTGTAAVYVLSSAQYDNYKLASDPQAYLDSTAIGTSSSQLYARVSDTAPAGTYSFLTGNALQLALVGSSTSTQGGTYDELRVGTTLADVAPVPEPGAWAMLATAAALPLAGWFMLSRRAAGRGRALRSTPVRSAP